MDEPERTAQIKLARQGNRDALQRLIVDYHGALNETLRGRMEAALRRVLDPDDVLQEAYTAAFQTVGRSRFDGPASFYRWLQTIVLNKLKDHERALRSGKRDVTRLASDDARTSYPELIQRVSAPGSTPSQHLAKGEAVAIVISSLARLTDDQREVVRLRFLEDKPVAEVAARMGRTEAAVHMLCHRALKALRELMGSITQYLSRL